MKKGIILFIITLIGQGLMAQAQIQFRSVDRSECTKSDYQSLSASFSFSEIESSLVETERGAFSQISMPGTYAGGGIGEPCVPVINRLIAIPMGAMPRVEVKSYSSSDYRLVDYGINTLMPRQPALRKNQRPEDIPFEYNETAYQTRGLVSSPQVNCEVGGVLRGVRIAQLSIDPVSYDPSSNTLRVFNDIEVEVVFDKADIKATEDRLLNTYSPYFEVVYDQLFNGEVLRDIWSKHPDIYQTPVRMLVITKSFYTQCSAFQDWVRWKKEKGFQVDVYTEQETGYSSRDIQDFLVDIYESGVAANNTPTFLVIIGNKDQVINSGWNEQLDYETTVAVTDLYYSIADYDIFPDIYTSRMPVKDTTELRHLVDKILTYEQYTMSDPSYLGNALLIAGADASSNPRYGQPAIRYATSNYFNDAYGYNNVYSYLSSPYTNCYDHLNSGVGFANYTAHGSEYSWQDPTLNVSMLNALTNEDKYFWAVGNCCLSGNWGTQNGFAQTILSAEHKGAFAYIGSCPETYWDFDFYFMVGSYNTQYPPTNPTTTGTGRGAYDAMFMDDMYNTLNAIPFVGNLSITNVIGFCGLDVYCETSYCWEQYHTLGDGSVMPYRAIPSVNIVSHAESIQPGASSFSVNAEKGSMVCISKDGEILGRGMVGDSGTVSVALSSFTAPGPLKIVVTRPQRQPYISDIIVGQIYNVTASVNPAEAGTVTGTGNYGLGSIATVVATANPGYEFVSWTHGNEVVSTNATYSFTVNGNINLTANFNVLQVHQITLASVLNGSIVSNVPVAMDGDEVVLTATPADGYTLDHWTVFKSDDISTTITVSNNQFTMPSFDVTVTAVFTLSHSSTIEVTIPPVKEDTSNDLPSQCAYKYSFTEQIYLASEISQPGTINSIAFCNYCGFSTTRNLDIYLIATSKTSFTDGYDWVSLTDSDKVYSGTVAFKSGSLGGLWTTIALSTPFVYDGTSNILVAVDDNTGAEGNMLDFGVYQAEANRTLFYRSDNNNMNPVSPTSTWGDTWDWINQIRFNIQMAANDEAISVSPNTISGFEAAAGSQPSDSQSFSLMAENLTGHVIVTAPEHFEIAISADGTYGTSLDFVPVNGRVATMIYVRLKSNLANGDYHETITITSGTSTQTVTLSGSVSNGVVYSISASIEPIDSGTVQGAGTYGEGATATLAAIPNAGYIFLNWTEKNSVVSSETTYSFTVTGDRTLVAHFEQAPAYKIDYSNMVNGTVTCDHNTAMEGETITIGANPNNGYEFSEWIVYKSIDINTRITVRGNTFTMPSYDVTVLAVFLNGNLFNGTVSIPESGNSNYSNVLPSACDINYSVTEQIYTAAEIGHSGMINTIAFRSNAESGVDFTRNIDIYLRHTNKSSFNTVYDWVNLTNSDKVFSGEVTFPAVGWAVITLDTPFEYNGSSNLLVGMDDNTGSEDLYYYYYFASFETSVTASLYNNADDDLSMSSPDYSETVTSRNKNQIRFGISNTPTLPYHIINQATTIDGDLAIDADNQYIIAPNGILTVNGDLSCNKNGYLQIQDGGQLYSNSSNVKASFHKTIQKSSSDQDGWELIATPMSAPSIANMTANTYDLYAYDEGNHAEEWQNYKSSSFSLMSGQGYLYANSAAKGYDNTDLIFTGTLTPSGNVIQVNSSYNATYSSIKGFNLIGNPFPHNISMSNITINGVAISEYYIIGNGNQIIRCTSGEILPGQGFFIKVDGDNKTIRIE